MDKSGAATIRQYFDITKLFLPEQRLPGNNHDAAHAVSDSLADSVAHHLVADVPVGVFLSSGVDSGLVTSKAAEKSGASLNTVTIGFEEFHGTKQDETVLAAEVAQRLGTTHCQRNVTREEFNQDLDHILTAMDQPTIDGINIWYASKAAAEQGLKVMLSGVGGDELFAGYPSFKEIPLWRRRYGWLSRLAQYIKLPGFANWIQKYLAVSPKALGIPWYAYSWGGGYLLRRGLFMPWELPRLMGQEKARAGLDILGIPECFEPVGNKSDGYSVVASMESRWYLRNQLLRDTDWASMAHSVEVRTPLVDVELTRALAPRIAQDPGKHWLSSSLPSTFPRESITRAKTGFTTPVGNWLADNDRLDQWKRHPSLRGEHIHWSRRYAVCLHEMEFSS